MLKLGLAFALALSAAATAKAAVFFPTETTMKGGDFGTIRVSGSTKTADPVEVSLALTVSGSHGLACDGRSDPISCSNGYYFEVMSKAFDPLLILSGGDFFASYRPDETIPALPPKTASKTEVILTSTVVGDFSFEFWYYNQGQRLQSVSVSTQVFTADDVAAVPLPASSVVFASGLLALLLLRRGTGRRRMPG